MWRSVRFSMVVILIAFFGSSALAVAGPTRAYSTSLTGEEEVPGPGDPDATGNASVTLSRPNQRQICVSLSWADVSGEDADDSNDAVVAAHIHEAPAGSAGPVVFTIFSGQSLGTSGSFSMCGSARPRLITAIQNHPEDYYVNVHSGEYPAGAVRGQLGD